MKGNRWWKIISDGLETKKLLGLLVYDKGGSKEREPRDSGRSCEQL